MANEDEILAVIPRRIASLKGASIGPLPMMVKCLCLVLQELSESLYGEVNPFPPNNLPANRIFKCRMADGPRGYACRVTSDFLLYSGLVLPRRVISGGVLGSRNDEAACR